MPIEQINPEESVESNIIGFFRTGSIYFKPSNQLSFTFSELNLPNWVENKMRNVSDRPRSTNPGKAWGAYNLKLNLGINSEETDKDPQISLKPFSIETCYGYWVPSKYRPIVNEKVNQKSENIKDKLIKISNLMDERGKDCLITDYQDYLNDVKTILKSNSINYSIDEQALLLKYEKFIARITRKLTDLDRLNRLSLSLVSTGMPEIWEDNVAYKEFSESFYEYIACSLTGKKPRVVHSIMDRIGFSSEADSDEIASKFIEYFENGEAEWADKYWKIT